MATIKDVAKHANVAVSTASAVINNKGYISDDVRSRVEKAVVELGYTKNRLAYSLKMGRSNMIAVVIPRITSPFFLQILKGIENAAREKGFSVFFMDSDKSLEGEKECLELLKGYFIRGIILDTVSGLDNNPEYLNYLKNEFVRKNIPIVLVESDYHDGELLSVSVNNYECSYKSVQLLIDKGHKKIAYIRANKDVHFAEERTRGYKDALRDNGLTVDSELVATGTFSPTSGYNAMNELLKSGKEFTALSCANDQMLIGAMKSMKENNLSIPDDVAVVGFDDIFISSILSPALTTVRVPCYDMGYSAVQMLIKKCKAPEECESLVLQGEIIERESSNKEAKSTWDLTGW